MAECVIPVIDLSSVTDREKHGDGGRAVVAAQLRKALQDYSTCHVINHGVSLELLKYLQEKCSAFFDLPAEEKRQYRVLRPTVFAEGLSTYTPPAEDPSAGFSRETMVFRTRPIEVRREDRWPQQLRKEILAFSDALYELCDLLLGLLAESLGLHSSAFRDGFGSKDKQIVGAHHYPFQTSDHVKRVGLPSHVDTTVITALFCNGVPGLQLLENDEWATVRPCDGAFYVQSGAFLEVLSNGIFKARTHRVMAPMHMTNAEERGRITFVTGPRPLSETTIGPLSQLVGSDTPALYKSFHVGEACQSALRPGSAGGSCLDLYKINVEQMNW